MLSRYNKDRPFLVVEILNMVPKKAATQKKNYGKTGEWLIGESITIEDCIKDSHITKAAVIIDILKAKLIKNRLDKSDEEVMKYFVTKYKKEITEGIQIWMRKKGVAVSDKQINKIEQNIDQQDIIALTLTEGDSENIADKIQIESEINEQ